MGQREDLRTIASCLLDLHGRGTDRFIAARIRRARALGDDELAARWSLIRQAVWQLARDVRPPRLRRLNRAVALRMLPRSYP